MYGTCETLCRALAAKYPGDTPLMLVIWSPEEIQALADGMDISLSDHEIRTVLARLEDCILAFSTRSTKVWLYSCPPHSYWKAANKLHAL